MRLKGNPVIVAVAGTLAGVVLIFVILWLMLRVSPAPEPVPAAEKTPAEILEEVRAEERKLETYGWVDKEKGIVRIPIEEAMEKLIAESVR